MRVSVRFTRFLSLCGMVFALSLAPHAYAAPGASLVAEADTGKIIYGANIYSLRHPASLTKIMTLYMVFAALDQGRISLNDTFAVSDYATTMPPSKLGLKAGERIRVRDAILGLVTQSANDDAVTIAEGIAGSEWRFAQMMTEQAHALGMKRTIYRNASGLHDDEQVTTAFDQAILARAMLYHFPKYYSYFKTRAYTWNGVKHANHNRLMSRYEGMDGIKTGYIRQSGFNLVASARRYGKRLIGVVFGGRTAKSRDNYMAELLDSGFAKVVAENGVARRYAQAPVIQNDSDVADVGNDQPSFSTKVAQGDDEENDEATDTTASSDAVPSASTLIKQTKAVLPKKNPPAAAPSDDTWSVQVGAYDSRRKGMAALTTAKRKATQLQKAKAQIVTARNGKRMIFRARLTGLSEQTARSACSKLGNSCLTLPPRG